jgi:predicted PurR-regulated permease PerM
MVDGEPLIPLERLEELTGGRTLGELISSGDVDVLGAMGNFFGSIGGITGPAFSVVGAFFGFLVNMAFMLVIMFYFMRDGDRFAENLVNITPMAYRGDVRRMLYELGKVWNAYFRGQLILCTLVGIAVYIAALVLGLPRAEILGLLAGILEFIPNFGPFLALVPAFFMALVSESTTLPFLSGLPYALIVGVVWTLIQNLEAIYLVPRVMGGNLNLHPVMVIIGVLAGASVAGAIGIILAAPSMATIRLFGQYIYGKLFDLDPFPQPELRPPSLYVRVPGRMLNGVRERSRYFVRYAAGVSRSTTPAPESIQPDETLPS